MPLQPLDPLQPETTDVPNDFDQAYDWFASAYSNRISNETATDEVQPREGSESLLNKNEQTALSTFFDNVLTNPTTAASSDEVHWLDSELYTDKPTGQYVPLFTNYQNQPQLQQLQRQQLQGLQTQPGVARAATNDQMPPTTAQASDVPKQEYNYRQQPLAQSQVPQNQHPSWSMGYQPQHSHYTVQGSSAQIKNNSNTANFGSNTQTYTTAGAGVHGQYPPNSIGPGPYGSQVPQAHNGISVTGQPVAQPLDQHQVFATGNAIAPQSQDGISSAQKSEFYKGFVEFPTMESNSNRNMAALVEAQTLFSHAQFHLVRHIPDEQASTPLDSNKAKNKGSGDDSTPPGSRNNRKRRDYLSEDQIRLNHIHSEKRRRDLIKQLFSDMTTLVPSVGSTADQLPKSLVLQKVYNHMLELAKQNKAIRGQLEAHQINTSSVLAHKLAPQLPPEPEDELYDSTQSPNQSISPAEIPSQQ